MIAGIPSLELFGVRLTTTQVRAGMATLRCEFEGRGLRAQSELDVLGAEIADLLDQVEQQYTDFARPVSWGNQAGPNTLKLRWSLNANGHAQGRFDLDTLAWCAEGDLDGDQSYLPKLALGLRLILRALNGEPL